MTNPDFVPSFEVCKECGFTHPPNPPGKKCSMAKEKTSTGKEIDFSKFFANLKNILASKIREKKIENTEALFGKLLLEIFKVVDSYKEEK